jgi:ABC-type nitrate/sulfonate/bicarbonate transport system substrate-binding protein
LPRKRFFKEEGLDAELIQVNPRLGAIAVLNRDLDFTTTFGSMLRSIVQGGFPVRFVFVSVRKSEHSLFVRPEIKDIKGLAGKRFGVAIFAGLGSASW